MLFCRVFLPHKILSNRLDSSSSDGRAGLIATLYTVCVYSMLSEPLKVSDNESIPYNNTDRFLDGHVE